MNFNPKISIVIPVYNGEKYIREAIDSAFAQTYKNYEIIVVNDGSTDKTEEIVLSYGDRIRYFKKTNGGQSSALNYGISQMTGEYFSWLSHDDVYYPGKLEVQLNYINGLDDKEVIVFSDFENIDSKSKTIDIVQYKGITPENVRYKMLISTPIGGCTLLVPAQLIKMGFDESIPMVSDVDLWFKLSKRVPFIHIPEVLHKNRVHAGQVSLKKKKELLIESNKYLVNCLQETTAEDLKMMSGMSHSSDVYYFITTNFSIRGYITAAKMALSLYKKQCSTEGTKSKALKLDLVMISNYIHKSVRNKAKYFLYNHGIRK